MAYLCPPVTRSNLIGELHCQLDRAWVVGRGHGAEVARAVVGADAAIQISRWPLLRQIRTGAEGTGPEVMSAATRDLRPQHEGAEVTGSICRPACGCSACSLE